MRDLKKCACLAGFLLYLLDLTFRLAQWMNVSIITGSLVSRDVLALQLNFDQVGYNLRVAGLFHGCKMPINLHAVFKIHHRCI